MNDTQQNRTAQELLARKIQEIHRAALTLLKERIQERGKQQNQVTAEGAQRRTADARRAGDSTMYKMGEHIRGLGSPIDNPEGATSAMVTGALEAALQLLGFFPKEQKEKAAPPPLPATGQTVLPAEEQKRLQGSDEVVDWERDPNQRTIAGREQPRLEGSIDIAGAEFVGRSRVGRQGTASASQSGERLGLVIDAEVEPQTGAEPTAMQALPGPSKLLGVAETAGNAAFAGVQAGTPGSEEGIERAQPATMAQDPDGGALDDGVQAKPLPSKSGVLGQDELRPLPERTGPAHGAAEGVTSARPPAVRMR